MHLDPSLHLDHRERCRAVWMGTPRRPVLKCLDLSWRRYVQYPALLLPFVASSSIRRSKVGAVNWQPGLAGGLLLQVFSRLCSSSSSNVLGCYSVLMARHHVREKKEQCACYCIACIAYATAKESTPRGYHFGHYDNTSPTSQSITNPSL